MGTAARLVPQRISNLWQTLQARLRAKETETPDGTEALPKISEGGTGTDGRSEAAQNIDAALLKTEAQSNRASQPRPETVLPVSVQEPGVDQTLDQFLIEHSIELLSRHTPEGEYLYASPVSRALLGYEPPELVGRSIFDLVHPQDLAKIGPGSPSGPRLRQKGLFSYRLRHKEGHYVWVETTVQPTYQPETGRVQEILALSRDISERKQAEKALNQRSRELAVLQSAGVAMTSSLDLRFVLDSVTREIAQLLSVESCTIAQWDPAGNSIRKVARYGAGGWWDPARLPGVQNLDDFPLTRSVLEEQVPSQMTLNQPMIDPNEKAYMQMAGIKTRLVLPMIYHRNTVGLVELEDSREERSFTTQEMSLAKWLANLAASAIENARLYQQAQQEIGERQRAEEALAEERALLARRVEERTADLSKANAELARAARLKDEFLANVSHELRTPLNTILGSAEILHLETFGPVNNRQRKYVHNVEESGRHLLSLINDILDLSKAEAGKLIMEVRPVAIEPVCQASVRLIKQLAVKKNLQVSLRFENLAAPTLPVDELRLKQILVNLLSNAVKFTPEGGKIGLKVVGDVEHQAVHFTVWDSGIGISKEDMATLFKPFVQVESSLARQYSGTGLGLSLVARMTELHGGGVSVESELGQGSSFTISLPWPDVGPESSQGESAGETPADQAEAAPVQGRKSSSPTILVADDNEENINILLDYLQAQGYHLIVARNGGEAVERAREYKPDVILMDIQMPGMDGLEATRIIRLDPGLRETPVIALTALAMAGDRERCLKAGATDYLSKPVHLKGLAGKIESYIYNA